MIRRDRVCYLNALVRRSGGIILLFDLAADSLLSHELELWLAEVYIAVQEAIEGCQSAADKSAFIPVAPDDLAQHTLVLLLHVSMIVLLVLAGACDSEVFVCAVAQQDVIDELRAIVGVDTQ